MIFGNQKKTSALIAGTCLGIMIPVLYYFIGFSLGVLALWLAALVCLGFALYARGKGSVFSSLVKTDVYVFYLLVIIFVPLLVAYLYDVPFQVNTDEAVIMAVQKQYQNTADIFAHTNYFGFPALIFMATGWLAEAIGGISLLNTRLVHALMGVLVVLFTYLFFRQFWRTVPSLAAAAVLGFNHSFIAISRMAMRDNSALLMEVAALPFLFYGLKQRNYFSTFIGSIFLGLSFYVYHPGRIAPVVWFGFLIVLGLFMRRHYHFRYLIKNAAVTLGIIFVVSAPLLADALKHPNEEASKFSRERFLFYEEGRTLQQTWVSATTASEGVMINIKNGLGTFNNRVHDLGYIYPNLGHGFVDPLTGIFVWIGVVVVAVKFFWLKSRNEEDLLALSAFVFLWLLFSFVINKTPNYTRLLVILPFMAHLVIVGIMAAGEMLASGLKKFWVHNRAYVAKSFLLEAVLVIAVSNFVIFSDFIRLGLDQGNNVGSTARYIEQRKAQANYSYVLATDSGNMFYSWGDPYTWQAWMKVFTADSQSATVIAPSAVLTRMPVSGSFTLFLNARVWQQYEQQFKNIYPNYKLEKLTTDGNLLAVEVLSR